MTIKGNLPFMTVKCPVCKKGIVPFPLDDDFKCCRTCGATRETIDLYIKIDIQIGLFLLKYVLPIIGLILLIDSVIDLF